MTPRSLPVSGATPGSRCGGTFTGEYSRILRNNTAWQGGTQQDPGDSRPGRTLNHGHSPTGPEQDGQSQVLVTGSITSPGPGAGSHQDVQAGAAGNGTRGKWGVRLQCGSRRQATYDRGLKHIFPDLFGQHSLKANPVFPGSVGPPERVTPEFDSWDWRGICLLSFLHWCSALSYFSACIFHVI